MKNHIDQAQDYIDSGKSIPESVIAGLNREETEILGTILDFKQNIKQELNSRISDKPLTLKEKDVSGQSGDTVVNNTGSRVFRNIVLAAAAFVILLSTPGIYRNIETRKLIKEDARSFVGTITDTAWIDNKTPDTGADTEWFAAEPIVMTGMDY